MTALKSAKKTRVGKVVAILTPATGKDNIRIDVIEREIDFFENADLDKLSKKAWPPYPTNSADRYAAKRFCRAFTRLEDWFSRIEKRIDSDEQSALLHRMVHGEVDEFFDWKAQLTHWRERFEGFACVDRTPNLFFPKGDSVESYSYNSLTTESRRGGGNHPKSSSSALSRNTTKVS